MCGKPSPPTPESGKGCKWNVRIRCFHILHACFHTPCSAFSDHITSESPPNGLQNAISSLGGSPRHLQKSSRPTKTKYISKQCLNLWYPSASLNLLKFSQSAKVWDFAWRLRRRIYENSTEYVGFEFSRFIMEFNNINLFFNWYWIQSLLITRCTWNQFVIAIYYFPWCTFWSCFTFASRRFVVVKEQFPFT